MRKAAIFVLTALCLKVQAQYVSLNKRELARLKKVVDTSQAYQAVLQPYLATAATALTEAPVPIEKIRSQGLLEGNPLKTATQKAVKDAYKVYALALAYQLKGDKQYLDKALLFLNNWAAINKPTGDPIDQTKLEDMVAGYDLIRRSLNREQQRPVDSWFNSIADSLVNSSSAKPGRGTAINNWNSHRIKMITLIAYTVASDKYDNVIAVELEKQLNVNLNPDGTTIDFDERDAFHYHTYDLEPLLTAAIAINRKNHQNYFTFQTTKGASLKKCVDFMVPYMSGNKKHEEFVNSKVKFDRQRAQNHEKGYEPGTLFNPESGLYTLSLAEYFNPAYLKTIKVAANNASYINLQLLLNSFRDKATP